MRVGSAEGLGQMAATHYGIDRPAGATGWDASAFEQVFLENFSRVVSILIRLTGDRAQAEELANEVFWKLYRQPVIPGPEGNVPGWLYRTATNLGIDAVRARAKRRHYEETSNRLAPLSTPAGDPLSEILREEKCQQVREVLATLKPAQAQILVMRHSGFSYNELADFLGVSRGSVGTMLMRAEAEFHKHYVRAESRSGARSPVKEQPF
jgi:RNA polymerase sigma-70 factor (ECF subfamily)